MASLRGERRIAELCREDQISESLLRRWRDVAVDAASERLAGGQDRSQASEQRRIAELDRALGRKEGHRLDQIPPRVFAAALGITVADWRYLHDQILEALPQAPVRSTRITPFGAAYEVVMPIDGLNGATLPVVTTWIVETDAPPRLTSTWVDIP
jgi:transposase-like protein